MHKKAEKHADYPYVDLLRPHNVLFERILPMRQEICPQKEF